MIFRTLICCALALPLMAAAPALAQTDPRVSELEEQLRRLHGTIEELNFQILQMQDQMRRMQEDFEFRFQEIEQGGSVGGGSTPSIGQQGSLPVPSSTSETASIITDDSGASSERGAPPRDFGTIVFDAEGNVVGSDVLETPPQSQQLPSGGTDVAALPSGGDADSLYRDSYEFILSGDYATAEAGFRQFLEHHPGDPNEADAHFWLGEALLAQDRHRDAAEVFLAASRDFPDSRKAPEMLYKLATSLAALNQREVACATYAEVERRYPQASDALMERVRQGQSSASC
jgi:tol-pal system protein YbgF